MLRRFLREPLVHFLAIGLGLFVLFGALHPAAGRNEIRISFATVAGMKADFEKTSGRPPTPEELQKLIDAKIDDEIMLREGLAMKLDRDDAVIQRRVRQKYQLIADEVDSKDPSDAELQAFLKANPEKFIRPPVVSFSQVLLDSSGGEADVRARSRSALSALANGASPASLDRQSLLPAHVDATPLDIVARDYGDEFAASLARVPIGQWHGPVVSGFGLHLVRLESRTVPPPPKLEDVRHDVEREWSYDARQKAHAARMARLRNGYSVVVESASK